MLHCDIPVLCMNSKSSDITELLPTHISGSVKPSAHGGWLEETTTMMSQCGIYHYPSGFELRRTLKSNKTTHRNTITTIATITTITTTILPLRQCTWPSFTNLATWWSVPLPILHHRTCHCGTKILICEHFLFSSSIKDCRLICVLPSSLAASQVAFFTHQFWRDWCWLWEESTIQITRNLLVISRFCLLQLSGIGATLGEPRPQCAQKHQLASPEKSWIM